MADNPPGSWPTAEEEREESDKDEDSRPSTAEFHESLEQSESAGEELDNVVDEKRTPHIFGKHGIARMPELPPEIRETYAFSFTLLLSVPILSPKTKH